MADDAENLNISERKSSHGGARSGAGRKPKIVDVKVLERAASIGCTVDEISALAGITLPTLLSRIAQDPSIGEAIERARDTGRATLRRMQWNGAKAGNATMLIWLGKQILGQRDQIDQNLSGEIGLYRLTEDELRVRAHALLAKASNDG